MLLGGSPMRMITLSARGAGLVADWWEGEPVGNDLGERLLARRLLDAGLAHPDPQPRLSHAREQVTIVIPAHGPAEPLERCLAALAGGSPVIVVDDASPDGETIAALAGRFGAAYIRHPENRGAAAARNTGLELATSPIIAFLDSDCVAPPGFPGALIDHLADPGVALVAPRIVSLGDRAGRIAAYERCHSALDMGPHPSRVRPYAWVWYVPSAAMVTRREALGRGFDEQLSLERTSIWSGGCTTRDGRSATTRGFRWRIRTASTQWPGTGDGSPTTSRCRRCSRAIPRGCRRCFFPR